MGTKEKYIILLRFQLKYRQCSYEGQWFLIRPIKKFDDWPCQGTWALPTAQKQNSKSLKIEMKKSAEGEEKERYCHACGECRIENMRLGTFWPYKERTHKKAILGLKKSF